MEGCWFILVDLRYIEGGNGKYVIYINCFKVFNKVYELVDLWIFGY